MRIGIALNADWIEGNDEKLKHCLELVKASGANCCELIMHSMDVLLNGKLVECRVAAVKEVLKEYPFEYTIHMPYAYSPKWGGGISFFAECIKFAREIGAKVINVHASHIEIGDVMALDEDAEFYREVGCLAKDIIIGIETPCYTSARTPGNLLGASPQAMIKHIERINAPNVGITVDFGHTYISSKIFKRDFLHDIEVLSKKTVHLHVHENFGKPGNMENYMDNYALGIGDLHLPPGWGETPLKEALKLFAGYEGIYILETEFRLYPYFGEAVSKLSEIKE